MLGALQIAMIIEDPAQEAYDPARNKSWLDKEFAEVEPARLALRVMSDVEEKLVEWLWRGYLPRGKVTVFDGEPDQGTGIRSKTGQ